MGLDSVDGGALAQQDPLLPKPEHDERFNGSLFGHFKGFSITPLPQPTSQLKPGPIRPAPAPPSWQQSTTVPIRTNPGVKRPKPTPIAQEPAVQDEEVIPPLPPPALPPPNIGSTARPLISSPVLSTTTCTSPELIGSKRPAPDVPNRPMSVVAPPNVVSENNSNEAVVQAERRRGSAEKNTGNSTLTRIASMLYPISGMVKSQSSDSGAPVPTKYNTNSLPRSHRHRVMMDKDVLRSLEISNPIPQQQIEIAGTTIPVQSDITVTSPEKRSAVTRAQSMRESSSPRKITARPALQSFGSMRQPHGERPTSIPTARVRPSSPPPGPPVKAAVEPKKPATPEKKKKKSKPVVDEAYDDCMNLVTDQQASNLGKIPEESPSSDNIYAVIEESVPEKLKPKRATAGITAPLAAPEPSEYKTPKSLDLDQTAVDDGLLSEIVSEISNRNLDSIYSTKQLSSPERKPDNGTYANSETTHYKTPASLYSNSTTSSGYVHPSAVNVPVKATTSTKSPPKVTTPKTTKAAVKKKEEPKPTKTPSSVTPTPKVQKPMRSAGGGASVDSTSATSRQNSSSSLKGGDNSPDLVASCSSTGASKSPDVLGRAKRTTAAPPRQRSNGPTTPTTTIGKTSPTEKTVQKVTAGVKSNVASLQQKFEQAEKGAARKKPATTTTVGGKK